MAGISFTPLSGSVSVSATASSVATTITMPATANALYVANLNSSVGVTINYGTGAAAAVLGTSGISIPPASYVILETNTKITDVAAIGTAAGPSVVTFTPVAITY